MLKKNTLLSLSTLPLVLSLLTACGKGEELQNIINEFSGNKDEALVNESNAQDIGVASTNGALQAINKEQQTSPFGVSIEEETDNTRLNQIKQIVLVTESSVNSPIAATISTEEFIDELGDSNATSCGGSITFPDEFLDASAASSESFSNSYSITFNEVCFREFGEEVRIDGTIKYTTLSDDSYSIEYINFTFREDGVTYTLNETETCTVDNFGFEDCVITEQGTTDFISEDGTTDRLEDVQVGGSESTGFDINTTFTDNEHGKLTLTTIENLIIDSNCDTEKPVAGKLRARGEGDGTVTVTYESCTSYSGTWNNDSDSGTFSGTW